MDQKFHLTLSESELRVLDCALWLYIKGLHLDRFDIILSEIDDFKKHFDKVIDLRLHIRSCFDNDLNNALFDRLNDTDNG